MLLCRNTTAYTKSCVRRDLGRTPGSCASVHRCIGERYSGLFRLFRLFRAGQGGSFRHIELDMSFPKGIKSHRLLVRSGGRLMREWKIALMTRLKGCTTSDQSLCSSTKVSKYCTVRYSNKDCTIPYMDWYGMTRDEAGVGIMSVLLWQSLPHFCLEVQSGLFLGRHPCCLHCASW